MDPKPKQSKSTTSALLAALNLPGSVRVVTESGTISVAELNRPAGVAPPPPPKYVPQRAAPTPKLDILLKFRSINPLYGAFLLEHLGLADAVERLQILESVLEVPGSLVSQVRVPQPMDLPFGPLALERLHPELIARGLLSMQDIDPASQPDEERDPFDDKRRWALPLGDKVRLLFESDYPSVHDVRIQSVWIVGDLLHFGGDFQQYVTSRDLTKQEGLIFRHLLRFILLTGEFAEVTPLGVDAAAWTREMRDLGDLLTTTCRTVDPESTDDVLVALKGADLVAG